MKCDECVKGMMNVDCVTALKARELKHSCQRTRGQKLDCAH